MRSTRTATPIRPHRRTGRIVEGLFAAVGLVAFVVGVPVVLQIVAPISWPTTWPTWQQIWAGLSRPDDGTLFISALTLVVWVGWVWLTVSILIEVVVALTHLKIPAIPLLRLTRGAAKTLVATAGVLLTTSTPLVGSLPAHAATAIELVLPDEPTVLTGDASAARSPQASHAVAVAQRFTAPAPTAEVDTHPVVTVNRGDTLWSLAERHLGAGHRYTEILDLNLHRPQAGGLTLTPTGEHWLYDGWTLRLPTDAGALPALVAANADAPADAAPVVHDVVAGDTLWDIAETHLGDGARYPEIYDLNVGVPQPDGDSLTDPDLIRPDWRLAIPVISPQGAAPAPATGGEPVTPPRSPDRQDAPAPAKSDASGQASSDVDPRSYALPGGGETSPFEALSGESGTALEEQMDGAPQTIALVVGLTSLAAAGLTGELTRRRRRQHRLRRAGERIALPAPGSAPDQAEHALRRSVEPLTLDALHKGLILLGAACFTAGRDLPRIAVVLVGEDAIVAILTNDDDTPVPPFLRVDDRTWRTTHDAFRSQDDDIDLQLFPDPYPALVTLGITGRETVLVNLEATGTLSVTGPSTVTAATMRALACELATSSLTANAVLVLGPEHADLAEVSTSVIVTSVASSDDLDHASGVLAVADGAILASAGATDALHARSMLTGDDTWNPTVFLGAGQTTVLEPWAGQAIVTTDAQAQWQLDLSDDHTGRLSPIGLTIRAQNLPEGAYRNLLELLRNAAQETDRDPLEEPATVEEDLDEILTALPAAAKSPPNGAPGATATDLPSEPVQPMPVPQAPRVLLLGRVSVKGAAHARVDRERRNTELVAFLVCNPGASTEQVDDVIGHGARVEPSNRNAQISRARSWLGSDRGGQPYLKKVENHDDYRLDPAIKSDWDEFLTLANRGLAQGKDGALDLRAALALVRGRPFLGVPPGTYDWAEALAHEMIDTITDVAHALALISIDAHDYRGAQRAATIGLTANPCNEELFRDAIAAAHYAGDHDEADRLVVSLRTRIEQIDPDSDLEDETIELLELLALAASTDT
ncbi:MAG: LysM peptidoglycan-binding domain-containing protein [Cellulomonas sp.]